MLPLDPHRAGAAHTVKKMAIWTEEDDEKLRHLSTLSLSAAEIAARMPGRTKNSIIGRWHRTGITGKNKSVRSTKVKCNTEDQSPAPVEPRVPKILHPKTNFATVTGFLPRKKKALRKPPPLNHGEPIPLMVSLLDLKPRMCRWIYGDVGQDNFGYCGHETNGSSYCAYHDYVAHYGYSKTKLARAA